MKNTYKTLVETLTNHTAQKAYRKAGVSPCMFVDFYRGQYLNWENFDSFPLPAVLFEMRITHNNQLHPADFTLHLCYELPHDTSSLSHTLEQSLGFLDFVQATKDLLDGLETERCGKWELTQEEIAQDDSPVNVYLLRYACQYNPDQKEKYTQAVGEDLKMDVGLVNQMFDDMDNTFKQVFGF